MQTSNQSSRFSRALRNFLTIAFSLLVGSNVSAEEVTLPAHLEELAWAYAISTEKPPPLPETDAKQSLPDTSLTFTRDEIVGRKNGIACQTAPADWYPGDHPEMPEIYAKGDPTPNALCLENRSAEF